MMADTNRQTHQMGCIYLLRTDQFTGPQQLLPQVQNWKVSGFHTGAGLDPVANSWRLLSKDQGITKGVCGKMPGGRCRTVHGEGPCRDEKVKARREYGDLGDRSIKVCVALRVWHRWAAVRGLKCWWGDDGTDCSWGEWAGGGNQLRSCLPLPRRSQCAWRKRR